MSKRCFFCQHKAEPTFRELDNLLKFTSPRMKIVSSEKTNVCAKHQRQLSKEIKHARYLALLPYTSYQQEKMRQIVG
ncbi:30S ribosomal protein S18 [Candidatus Roizmanbacteria bacterium RIFCSPHIGHO2_01_FULL_39_12b]|uniref:30S ribosomal protein S18 n=1 Tax=Candidatus Roizmanbacteria bacterium RIFCSPHIGHO2_01_FULL_39_12b TaxID=1802030 RepID=A0A1F7G983_9BACT|nr:MAG: 30S ribosomal protein S18 [Candidatus Roizmanbacteria bacterium RIFCSPHIGHO2_01_FULL_39_12b]